MKPFVVIIKRKRDRSRGNMASALIQAGLASPAGGGTAGDPEVAPGVGGFPDNNTGASEYPVIF